MKYLVTAIAGVLLAGAAQADTLTFGFTNPLQTTEINQSGSLGLFDSNLGTLTSMTLSFTGEVSSSITLTNNALQAQTAVVLAGTDLSFSSSIGALSGLLTNPLLVLSVSSGSVTVASGGSVAIGPLSTNATTSLTSAQLSGIMSSFVAAGGGSFTVDCTSSSGVSVRGGGGNLDASQATQAACGAEVTYTYDQPRNNVPEPDALALVGIALAGLAISRKLRKA